MKNEPSPVLTIEGMDATLFSASEDSEARRDWEPVLTLPFPKNPNVALRKKSDEGTSGFPRMGDRSALCLRCPVQTSTCSVGLGDYIGGSGDINLRTYLSSGKRNLSSNAMEAFRASLDDVASGAPCHVL